MGGGNVRVVQ